MKIKKEAIISILKNNLKDLRILSILGLAICGIFAFLMHLTSNQDKPPLSDETPMDVTTHIPANMSIIPIEIQNFESVDSIFGTHGFVDIYLTNESGQSTGKWIVKGIKMLRSPRNPTQFGVLAHENDVPKMAQKSGPYFVVVRSRKGSTTPVWYQTESQTKGSRNAIIEEDDQIED